RPAEPRPRRRSRPSRSAPAWRRGPARDRLGFAPRTAGESPSRHIRASGDPLKTGRVGVPHDSPGVREWVNLLAGATAVPGVRQAKQRLAWPNWSGSEQIDPLPNLWPHRAPPGTRHHAARDLQARRDASRHLVLPERRAADRQRAPQAIPRPPEPRGGYADPATRHDRGEDRQLPLDAASLLEGRRPNRAPRLPGRRAPPSRLGSP